MINLEKMDVSKYLQFREIYLFNFLMEFGMAFSIIVFTGDIFLISLDEKYENRICRAGFSTFNKIRKVLPETGLRYPLLFSG